MRFLDLLRADLSDAFARFHGSSQSDQVRSRVTDESLTDLLSVSRDDLRHTLRQRPDNLRESYCRQRRLLAWLDDDRIAGDQCGSHFPGQQEERVVPGNNRDDDAVWLFDREIHLVLEDRRKRTSARVAA